MVPGSNFHLYVIIVGYSQYVSLNIKVGRQQKPPYGGIHKKHFLENLWMHVLQTLSQPPGRLSECAGGNIGGTQLYLESKPEKWIQSQDLFPPHISFKSAFYHFSLPNASQLTLPLTIKPFVFCSMSQFEELPKTCFTLGLDSGVPRSFKRNFFWEKKGQIISEQNKSILRWDQV